MTTSGFSGLVRCGDSGEVGDLAGACLFVQALRVSSLARRQVGCDIDLVEFVACRSPRDRAIFTIRRNESRNTDDPRTGEQGRDLANSADVFSPIFVGKAEVGIETGAHVVAIEHVDLKASLEERFLERDGESGFPRAG